MFLSASLTTADKPLLLTPLGSITSCFRHGLWVEPRGCHLGLWQLDGKHIGSLVGVPAHGTDAALLLR